MRICYLCSEYPPGPHGGIGTMTQILARALVRAGHQVRVVGIYSPIYPGPEFEEDNGVQVWRLWQPTHRFGGIRARYQLFQKVATWARKGEVDLIEVPDWDGWAAGWPRLPVPVVARVSGSGAYFAAELGLPVSRYRFCLERASLRRADFWCSVSRYAAERTQRLFSLHSGPSAILYNPVEIPKQSGFILRSKNQVVFSGTLTAKKGIISLIRAWPHVLETSKNAELHIYGKDGRTDDGQSMQAYLLSQIEAQARKSVHFHGHVAREKLLEVLQVARVGVFPSYAESFGLAPVEAMACCCPTIYSRRGPGPELIEDGKDALLVDPGRPDEIAEAILAVLQDDDLARRLGETGRERVLSTFTCEKLLPANEAFFADVIDSFAR